MERAAAIKTLSKMLGKSMAYRVDDKAPSPEAREEAKQQMKALQEAKQQAEKATVARREALLAGDEQFQKLLSVYKEARRQAAEAQSMQYHYKFSVGTKYGCFFHIKAEGDSWEEVINKLNGGRQNR